MSKTVSYGEIGSVTATFPVDSTTQAYLVANYTEPTTGDVDINNKQLAVKLNADGTVGFGASSATASDALFGVIIAYEMDGYATVQTDGYAEEVPTSAAVAGGKQALAVNDAGELAVVSGATEVNVIVAATSDSKYATIKF